LGFTDRQVALIFMLLSMISIGLVMVIQRIGDGWNWIHTIVFGGYFLSIVTGCFIMTHISFARSGLMNQKQ
jgi:ABC-type polysaccharide transport system permease subunit